MSAAVDEPLDDEMIDDQMCLVLPVPFRVTDGEMFVETQAGNGLDRWSDHFSSVFVAAPLIPESEANALTGFVWRPVDSLENRKRVVCQALPYAYTPNTFFKHLGPTRQLLSSAIAQSRYLQFGIGGLMGDWAAVAALEAIKQERRYAIHTDRVEHEVLRKTSSGMSAVRRLRVLVEAPLMKRYHRHIIQRCSLGLWHGDDCYRAYSPWCVENHLIHDIHTKPADLIDGSALREKIQRAQEADALELCYAGRLDPMKAPLEWLQAIAVARDMDVQLRATWYGEGPLLDAAKAEATRLNLDEVVRFPGFISDRATLLDRLRSAHAMIFTHVTPESPRILLESLVSGTPIVGYESAFSRDLVAEKGGGELVPMHDVQGLGRLIAELSKNRLRLAELIRQAASNGQRFTDAAVFAERSKLVQRFA
ncbi:MAG: glycosyltransferase [Acidobacteriaceae bacterium]|jgi:glycosyltransferase involved in cell wall biosynthesis